VGLCGHQAASTTNNSLHVNQLAGEPVSRILCGAGSCEPAATIIPLAPASRPGSSDLPEGSSFHAWRVAGLSTPLHIAQKRAPSLSRPRSTSRASSPLLFGLAPRGVCRASAITGGAVGSYPTFSPLPALPTMPTSRRFSSGLSPGCAPPAVCSLWHFP